MLDRSVLKDLLTKKEFTNTDKLLLCMAIDAAKPMMMADILKTAFNHGLRSAKNWNGSSLLSRSGGLAVRTAGGWELTAAGCEHVRKLCGQIVNSVIPSVSTSLRSEFSRISDSQIAAFVEEAIKCFELKLFRAAVVLSWVGALSVLYKHVIANRLVDFNGEAFNRNAKWKSAVTVDDLARMKESDFLDIIETISIIGKSVKKQLKHCLDLRNDCGHPNSFQLAENVVAAHVEVLLLNVFTKFSS